MSKKPGSQAGRFLNQAEQKRLLKKLQMKYGADLQNIEAQAKKDMEVFGFVKLETEAMREHLIEKIKSQEKKYS